jgi:agmatine/peptidylarginine deiminase
MVKCRDLGMGLSLLLIGAAVFGMVAFSRAQQPQDDFTFPAEFEPQQAVWINARPMESGKPVLEIIVAMVRALAPHVHVWVMVPTAEIKIQVQNRLRELKIDERQISYWSASSSLTRWYRDTGAIFLKNKSGDLKAVDFDFIPASYMNFFISTGVVLEAAYWQPGRPESMRRKDETAMAVLQRTFPNRQIVQIHAENLNYGGGGMHCATQQQPATARNMRYSRWSVPALARIL